MDAKVTWEKDLMFVGVADSGYRVRMDSASGPATGAGPVELTAMALAGCTAMDIISILKKKQQKVRSFEVRVHARRSADHPKVISGADMEYVVAGHSVDEASLLRAIELSVTRYCPVYAMLSKAFPIEIKYSIYEGDTYEGRKSARHGKYPASRPAAETQTKLGGA